MPNAKDAETASYQRILVAGRGGSGKTTQILTLPGRKFCYFFDPGALASVKGFDLDYEQFLPDFADMDATLKGFNKNAKPDDRPSDKKAREPKVYMQWVEDINKKSDSGFFNSYDWLIFDSLTTLNMAIMDRQMWLNNRFGGIEDLGDYRVAGSKITEVFRSIFSLPINIYCTGHISSFQDEKTKMIETQINLPGKSRTMVPLLCTNIWVAKVDDKGVHTIITKPESRGLQDIRTSIKGLTSPVDVTIKEFIHPERFGIGALLTKANAVTLRPKAEPSKDVPAAATVAPATGTTQPVAAKA